MIHKPTDAYKLLVLVKEMIKLGQPYHCHVLSDYASEDYCYRANEVLDSIEPIKFDNPHDFLICALDDYIDIQAAIWAEEYEIELMESSDDPDEWRSAIDYHYQRIKVLESNAVHRDRALSILEAWVSTGDLVYTKLGC